MAALLDELASKLVGILGAMVKEEVEMLLGVPGEITKLETTLRDLSHILADAERKRIRDRNAATEGWVKELKDVMYDADDVLDLCQLMEGGEDLTASTSTPKANSGCWDIGRMFSCFRNPVVAHKIGRKIQAINQKLEDIARRSSRFGFITQAINSSSDPINKASNSLSEKTGSVINQSDVVGERIEEDTKKIVDLLIKKADTPVVPKGKNDVVVAVAITGTGGIGKTTLARMVFCDRRIEENFEKRVWLSVNQEFNEINVLQDVLASFGAKYEGFAGNNCKDLLERALKDMIRQKKFLLVMDDVWSEKVWNVLLRSPLSHGASGSRVLVTTRNAGVARGMKAQHLHRVDKLQTEDAWFLLKNQVVLDESDEDDVEALKDIGMEIVETCDCLPLAVKVLGGLLSRKSRTRNVWKDVSNHDTWSTTGVDEDINRAVCLSYEDLPSHLKQCFVYCSLFPKHELIRQGDISRLWIAEGYIHDKMSSKASKSLEDLGVEYYRELISRNLLEPDKSFYDMQVCNMHDVVRSFAQYIMKDEGVLLSEGQDANGALSTPTKLRYLSISNKAIGLGTIQKQASLRTLMLFGSTTVELKDLLHSLSCLRVLLLYNVDLVELTDSICHLRHLRLLYLCYTSISSIPQGIGDLKFLQTIYLAGCTNISQLPSSIIKLRKLRSLNLRETAITLVPRGFRQLEDLETMCGFPTHSDGSADGWCSLEELGPLSKLQRLEIGGLEKAPSGSMAAKAMLSSKNHLKILYLIFTSRLGGDGEIEDDISEEEHQRTEEVLTNLCAPTCIEELLIAGYFARGLPQWMRTMSVYGSLRMLYLQDYACCTQLPNGLGQLPFLDRLSVERAPSIQCIGHDFLFPSLGSEADGDVKGEAPGLAGTRNNRRQSNHISRGSGVAFPKLRALTFEGMPGWTEWDWEHRAPAMPVIEVILINNCKLQRLPAGLAHHACRLRELDLRNMQHLVSVENFPSLVKLLAYDNPRLERISNNPSLQWIDISNCRELKEFDGLPSLRSMEWWDWDAEALPQYLQETNLKKLRVDCSRSLLKLIAQQDESSEWGKIKHVQQLKAYGHKTKNEEEEPDQSSQEDEEANEEEGNQPEVDEVNEDANQAKEEEDADEDKANQSEEDEADEENDQSEEDKEDGWYIYYTKEPYSFDVYLGESTGNFIFHLLSGFINVNLQVT
ncbi:hypothetical protein HU200_045293 [Digitaria exilis]|uniref:Uncharacterized protein n=1 Tax=Digitaria exilis TaxID=1010633 RepID=A0A835AXW7_9POAL|nr:hypothetical protein HU200_045293 [Digitaria exilis]